MEEWKTYKIGNLCSISSSKRIFAKEYQSSGIPFFRGKEIIEKQKGESVSTELYISKSRYDEIKNKFGVPKEGDMLLTSVGTLGIPYIVKNETFYFKDGNLTWFTDFKEINSKFLYYWLKSEILDLSHYQNFYEFPKFRIKLLILILLHFNIVRIIY